MKLHNVPRNISALLLKNSLYRPTARLMLTLWGGYGSVHPLASPMQETGQTGRGHAEN